MSQRYKAKPGIIAGSIAAWAFWLAVALLIKWSMALSAFAAPPDKGNVQAVMQQSNSRVRIQEAPALPDLRTPDKDIAQTPALGSDNPYAAERSTVELVKQRLLAIPAATPLLLKEAPGSSNPITAVGHALILPILPQNARAFGDISALVAEQLSLSLQKDYPQLYLPSPNESLNRLKSKRAWPAYLSMARQYESTGSVSPTLWKKMEAALQESNPTFNAETNALLESTPERLILVESVIDWTQSHEAPTRRQRVLNWLGGGISEQGIAYLQTRVSVFEPQGSMMTLLWKGQQRQAIPLDQLQSIGQQTAYTAQTRFILENASLKTTQALLATAPAVILYQPDPYKQGTSTTVSGRSLARPSAEAIK